MDNYPISFEKRFRILPDGLVLKNRIDAEITPSNIVLCNFCEARAQIAKKLTDLKGKMLKTVANFMVFQTARSLNTLKLQTKIRV